VDVYINLAAPRLATSKDPTGLASDAARIADNASDFVMAAKIPHAIVLSSIAASLAEKGAHSRHYGIEKLAADQIFMNRLSKGSQLVVLRPPAVYGRGMNNSLSMLASMVRLRLPLPLGLAHERRHYISITNLCDLIEKIVSGSETQWLNAAGKIFEPSDGTAISTRELVKMIGKAMNRQAILIPFPVNLLRTIGAAIGRADLIGGAIDRLDVAPSKELEDAFGWRPTEKMPDSLAFLAEGLKDV
jgi:UDP-glucose 4-epimerase